MKRSLCLITFLCCQLTVFAQEDSVKTIPPANLTATGSKPFGNSEKKQPIYRLRAATDIPVFVVAGGWSLYALQKIYDKTPSTPEQVMSLDKNNINGFDRWAVRPFDKSLETASWYPFFASMSLPLFFLAGKTNKDFFKLTFLYLEAMSTTGLLYTGAVAAADRYRPYAYDNSGQTTMQQRTRGGARNSFYAGHVALVATSSFFAAKVYADYHPQSSMKYILYSLAAAGTGITAYLRYRSGQHFPSDILLGIVQGTLAGLLTPQIHKPGSKKNNGLSFLPYSDGESRGVTMMYSFR